MTVNNFVVLSRYHFYDDVPFHRIIPGFVDQAGDPVGPSPAPAARVHDRRRAARPSRRTYLEPGTVAMANSGAEHRRQPVLPRDGDEGGALSGAGSYSVFGKVTEGMDVSEAIDALGGADEQPTKPRHHHRRSRITES